MAGSGACHELLVLDDGGRTLVDLVAALVTGQALEILQPVGLRADLDGIADHWVEVDEESRGHHLGQRRLTDTVIGGQALQGRSLRVVVVVDVHVRVRGPAIPAGTR